MAVRSGSERCDFIQQNIGVQNGVCGAHIACKSFGFNIYGCLGGNQISTSPHAPKPYRTSSNKLLIISDMLRMTRPCKFAEVRVQPDFSEGTIAGTLITFCGYGTNPPLKAHKNGTHH
jgi:hypothetical protein